MAPPRLGSTDLVFCTPKCRKQRENRSKKRSKLALQRSVQKMMESIGFFARSRRPKIGPPSGAICASVVAILGVDFGTSSTRIDGSLFLHPKMSQTEGESVQKEVKTGTPKICPKNDGKYRIFCQIETTQNWTPFWSHLRLCGGDFGGRFWHLLDSDRRISFPAPQNVVNRGRIGPKRGQKWHPRDLFKN